MTKQFVEYQGMFQQSAFLYLMISDKIHKITITEIKPRRLIAQPRFPYDITWNVHVY